MLNSSTEERAKTEHFKVQKPFCFFRRQPAETEDVDTALASVVRYWHGKISTWKTIMNSGLPRKWAAFLRGLATFTRLKHNNNNWIPEKSAYESEASTPARNDAHFWFPSFGGEGGGVGWVGIMVTNYSVWLQLQTQAGKPCLTFPTVPLWSVIIIMIGLISGTLCAEATAGWSQATVAEERRRAINWGGEDDGHESLQQQSINNVMVLEGEGRGVHREERGKKQVWNWVWTRTKTQKPSMILHKSAKCLSFSTNIHLIFLYKGLDNPLLLSRLSRPKFLDAFEM